MTKKPLYPFLRSGVWSRSDVEKEAEKKYAKLMGAKYCLQLVCPECDQLVKESVGFHSNVLLGTKQDMDDIYNAILKIYENRDKLR